MHTCHEKNFIILSARLSNCTRFYLCARKFAPNTRSLFKNQLTCKLNPLMPGGNKMVTHS